MIYSNHDKQKKVLFEYTILMFTFLSCSNVFNCRIHAILQWLLILTQAYLIYYFIRFTRYVSLLAKV